MLRLTIQRSTDEWRRLSKVLLITKVQHVGRGSVGEGTVVSGG